MNGITKSFLIMILLTRGFMTFSIIIGNALGKTLVGKWAISDFRRRCQCMVQVTQLS